MTPRPPTIKATHSPTVHAWNNLSTGPIFTRDAPCTCSDCPDCTTWLVRDGDATYSLSAIDNGNCYVRNNDDVVFLTPIALGETDKFCITIKNNATFSGDVYLRPPVPRGAQFSIDGVLYDYITVDLGGTVCVCYDGTNFVVTGQAHGWSDGPK